MSTDVANRILFEAQEVEKRRKAGLLSPAAIISPKNRKIATTKEAPDGTPALQAQVKETHATSPDKHDEVVTAQKTKLSDPASPATVTIPRLDHFNFLAVLGKGNFGMLSKEVVPMMMMFCVTLITTQAK